MYGEVIQTQDGTEERTLWWDDQIARFITQYTPNTGTPDLPPPTCNSQPPNNEPCTPSGSAKDIFQSSRSRHPDGVNACMCDGSVRFFNDTIEATTWYGLGTIAGGEVLGELLTGIDDLSARGL